MAQRKGGISKSKGYTTRVFCAEYDLKGMIDAYGINFVHWLADEIAAGKINCKSTVQRWSAHVAITEDFAFDASQFLHNDDDMDLGGIVDTKGNIQGNGSVKFIDDAA